MTVFDLLFLGVGLLSILTLLTAMTMAIAGRRGPAARLLVAWSIAIAGYLGASVAVSFFRPQRILHAGDPWCFDDWCLAVESVHKRPDSDRASYVVDIRIFSDARRVSQRANGAWISLIDAEGRRYAPDAIPGEIPLDVRLAPSESRRTTRTFAIPNDIRPVGLITGHGGAYCGVGSLLIVGNGGCLFNRPTMIILPFDGTV